MFKSKKLTKFQSQGIVVTRRYRSNLYSSLHPNRSVLNISERCLFIRVVFGMTDCAGILVCRADSAIVDLHISLNSVMILIQYYTKLLGELFIYI